MQSEVVAANASGTKEKRETAKCNERQASRRRSNVAVRLVIRQQVYANIDYEEAKVELSKTPLK